MKAILPMLARLRAETERMNIREALTAHYLRKGLLVAGEDLDDLRRARWIRMHVFGRTIPIKPMLGQQQPLLLHDIRCSGSIAYTRC